MKGYNYLNHTADVEFVARGKTPEEAFSNALLALFDTIADIKRIEASGKKGMSFAIKETSDNLNDLLWLTLQDALSISDAKGVFAYAVETMSISGKEGAYKLSAKVLGKKEDQATSRIYAKGVSRFDLRVKKEGAGYTARAVIDI
jgi:SHS2 domain-containing protein